MSARRSPAAGKRNFAIRSNDGRKRKARTTDHVRMADNPMAFICENCGDRYPVGLPIAFDMLEALSKTFLKKHRGCVKVA